MGLDILITGANRGIGLEFARQLAARGDRVVATCRNPEAAEELAGLPVEVAALDVSDAASVAQVATGLAKRPLDVLINCAGVGVRHRPLGEIDFDQVEHFYRVNAMGPLRLTEALLPALRRGERRLVANLTSRMGSIADNTSSGSYGYRASKAGLNAMTKSLAIDLADESFTCVVLHPGWVQTAMGGPNATVSVEQSVAGMLHVLDGLETKDTAGFFDYTGEELPW
jgi:NAD(P)-dependent dehydrogenase (short-subunit alcohol dehydrogenase family)